jgi:hypothetical protein
MEKETEGTRKEGGRGREGRRGYYNFSSTQRLKTRFTF